MLYLALEAILVQKRFFTLDFQMHFAQDALQIFLETVQASPGRSSQIKTIFSGSKTLLMGHPFTIFLTILQSQPCQKRPIQNLHPQHKIILNKATQLWFVNQKEYSFFFRIYNKFFSSVSFLSFLFYSTAFFFICF